MTRNELEKVFEKMGMKFHKGLFDYNLWGYIRTGKKQQIIELCDTYIQFQLNIEEDHLAINIPYEEINEICITDQMLLLKTKGGEKYIVIYR